MIITNRLIFFLVELEQMRNVSDRILTIVFIHLLLSFRQFVEHRSLHSILRTVLYNKSCNFHFLSNK